MASSATKLSLENIKALFNLMDDERLATYKYVKQLQNNFKNELTELHFMEKIEKSSRKQQAIINTPNKVLEIPDFQLTEMKIFEEPKKKYVMYTEVVIGSSSNDSWLTSPSLPEKWIP
ncbi:hypothetical protein RhiirA5_413317 [Rhizophagus irregularis]|uniref:Uncharacterized protein n=1 Tax=Rhizophagus irregularis TaxID=588596 RepID=A0A2I1EC90_9GLOM|nr:hypothetical protein RhiirA5_413317 [Rhizophagus irregularis]PKC63264.1 hypothetical protein RhiirA1_463998 [Rhizophagus irregularis]PKY19739.1 hypothetical protein RhiirB3_432861 [Rhizophagus irregularis]